MGKTASAWANGVALKKKKKKKKKTASKIIGGINSGVKMK
jgi:hypothetical protein